MFQTGGGHWLHSPRAALMFNELPSSLSPSGLFTWSSAGPKVRPPVRSETDPYSLKVGGRIFTLLFAFRCARSRIGLHYHPPSLKTCPALSLSTNTVTMTWGATGRTSRASQVASTATIQRLFRSWALQLPAIYLLKASRYNRNPDELIDLGRAIGNYVTHDILDSAPTTTRTALFRNGYVIFFEVRTASGIIPVIAWRRIAFGHPLRIFWSQGNARQNSANLLSKKGWRASIENAAATRSWRSRATVTNGARKTFSWCSLRVLPIIGSRFFFNSA